MAQRSIRQVIGGLIAGDRAPVRPTQEQGVAGFVYYGGWIGHGEQNPKLAPSQRWRTARDLLSNISVIAASLRFLLNLISRPAWSFEPADESDEAAELAEFMEDVLNGMDTSWTRIVRRAGMYRFHGFGMHEWVAEKRDDGRIGLRALEPRPGHTIERWDIDSDGGWKGVWQRDPQTGQELYIPRAKLLYLVDDSLTDSPDGMGWFRQLVEPADRLRSLLDLESMGYERDMRGIPVGRAPFNKINQLVADGKLTQQQADKMLADLRDAVTMQRKTHDSGIVLDSTVYEAKADTGTSPSQTYQWGLDIIHGEPTGLQELGAAVMRLETDMCLIMGTEGMLTGRDGEGSRALSEDKSRNIYLNANAILADMAEAVDRDVVGPIWDMNGFDEKLKPTARVEDVSFRDANLMAQALRDMATAGAVLAPDDPAIDALRDLLGLPAAVPLDASMLAAMNGQPDPNAAANADDAEPGADDVPAPDDAQQAA